MPPPRSSRRLRAGTLEALVRHLLDARTSGADMTFTPALLATHRAFTSTPALFGLVTDRSGAKGGGGSRASERSQHHRGVGVGGLKELHR